MTRDGVLEVYRQLQTQWNGRNAEYDLSRRRYHGEHWDATTNPAPVNRYSLTANYLKPFTDKSVQLLVARLPAVQVMPPGVDQSARDLAEQLEGIIYGTWEYNDAGTVFMKTAWDSFVLRRGLIYTWWDAANQKVKFKNCAPEHFYPEYDGDEIYRCVYVQKRSTVALKEQYPDMASDIIEDEMDYHPVEGASLDRTRAPGQTTVIDMWIRDGKFYRVMGNAFFERDLKLPWHGVPFVEFPCYPVSGETEPLNLFDQIVELNQYFDQLISQNADIISRYANPVILDEASGQTPEAIRKAMSGPGAVIPVRKNGDIRLLGWQGNIPAIQEQMTLIVDTMFDLAGKPRSSFGQTVTNQSGVVTNLALTPTLQSNEYHETIWGARLSELNRMILMLWEQNMKGSRIEMSGRYRMQSGSQKYYEVSLTGAEIDGWYKNRIKWPSAIRTDDPVYVQNNLQQLQSDPPAVSLYTYLERQGTEDVEAEIDRIEQQLEDPRLYPDRLTSAVGAASTLEQSGLPLDGEFGGFAPDGGLGGPPLAPGGTGPLDGALEAGANPNKDSLVSTAKGY